MRQRIGLGVLIAAGASITFLATDALDDAGRSFPILREIPGFYFASGTLAGIAGAYSLQGTRADRIWRAILVAYVTLIVAGSLAIAGALQLLFVDGQPIGYGAPRTLNGAFYLGVLPPLAIWIGASRVLLGTDWRLATKFGLKSWGFWLLFLVVVFLADGMVKQYIVYRRFLGR